MSWQDQGRQEHDYFGSGAAPPSETDKTITQRVAYTAHSVIGHLPRSDRTRSAASFDAVSLGRLQNAVMAWNAAANLPRDAFRQKFLEPFSSDTTVDLLRGAAQTMVAAKTTQELGAAGVALTKGMLEVSLDRCPAFWPTPTIGPALLHLEPPAAHTRSPSWTPTPQPTAPLPPTQPLNSSPRRTPPTQISRTIAAASCMLC